MQESPGPPGPKSQKKSQKRSSRGVGEKSQNISKMSKNTDLRTFLGIFRFFRVFLGTFLQTPEKTFFEFFFCDFGPEGPRDSCKWRLGSQNHPFTFSQVLWFSREFPCGFPFGMIPRVCQWWFPNGGSSFRNELPLPPSYLNFTSVLPLF